MVYHRIYIFKILIGDTECLDFPDNSIGKESACNAGDPSLIPGSGRSSGEGKGYPLQYSGLENPGPWAHKESGTTEGLSLSLNVLEELTLASPCGMWNLSSLTRD